MKQFTHTEQNEIISALELLPTVSGWGAKPIGRFLVDKAKRLYKPWVGITFFRNDENDIHGPRLFCYHHPAEFG